MPGRPNFTFSFGDSSHDTRREPTDPFHVLVIGDFRGRESRGERSKTTPTARRVDVDEFDALLEAMAPNVALEFGEERVDLAFRSIDDFHPDALLEQVPALQLLQQQRRRLRDPEYAATLLGEVQQPKPEPEEESEDSTFERILGAPRSKDPAAASVESLLADVLRPHLVPSPDPRIPDLVATLDATATGLLREILHHPNLQRLEANWRGLQWLVQNLETDEELRVSALDMTRADLDAATGGDDPADGPLHSLLIERSGADAQGYSMVVVLHEFGAELRDARTLAVLGAYGARGGFPFVVTADPRSVLGCASLEDDPKQWQPDAEAAEVWNALRASPQAGWIGAVLPRFLLRLPYGEATDEIDGFAFEEMPAERDAACYLWGQPGLAIAMLLGRTFRTQGWQMSSLEQDVGGLPCHTFKVDGETRLQPCAEVLWNERAASAAVDAGLMVLQSYANRDAARLIQLRSIAEPATSLAGPWQL